MIEYGSLAFETTRRCNQNCKHCMCGPSQNIDLTEKLVDDFFNKNEIIRIHKLNFSGGEPTLNPNIVEYIVEQIIERRIDVRRFYIVINGLIFSSALIKALARLNKYCREISTYPTCRFSKRNMGGLLISVDEYHITQPEEIINKYLKVRFCVPPNWVKNPYEDRKDLVPSGNAITNGLTDKKLDINEIINANLDFKTVDIEKGKVLYFPNQYICANGNFINYGCASYEIMDKYAIGNIADDTIINTHKTYCLKKKKRIIEM